MHIGIIGVGRIGSLHAELVAALPEVDRVTLCDATPALAERVAKQLSGTVETRVAGLDPLLADVDAVVIAASTPAHPDLILRSVAAGRPTFCEKPVTLDLDSTAAVAEAVGRENGAVQIGFQRRFDPGFAAAKESVVTGSLGTLYVVRMIGHDPAPPPPAYIQASGGLFRDFSVHDFDALRFVTGDEVVEVYADGSVREFPEFEAHDDVDTGVALLRLRSGAFALLTTTRQYPFGYDIRMELVGSKDSAMVGWDARAPIRSFEPEGPRLPEAPYANFQERFRAAYAAELAAFLEYARGERANPCTVEDAMEALRIAVACDRSRRSRAPVSIVMSPRQRSSA